MEGKEKKRKNKDEGPPKEVEKKPKTQEKVGNTKSYSAIKRPERCTDASVYLSAVLGIDLEFAFDWIRIFIPTSDRIGCK